MDHYRQIFELTRLDEAIGIHDDEADALGRSGEPRDDAASATPTAGPSPSPPQRGDVPDGATNINVDGRRLTSPIQGFGKMWQKTYQVRMPADARRRPRS